MRRPFTDEPPPTLLPSPGTALPAAFDASESSPDHPSRSSLRRRNRLGSSAPGWVSSVWGSSYLRIPFCCAALWVSVLLAGSCGGAKGKDDQPPSSLPPLKVDPFAGLDPLGKDDAQPFTFRKGPKAPPTTTKAVSLRFPVAEEKKIAAAAAARMVAKGPLKVTRVQPKGEAKNVGAVSVTFNQPMVPVTSLQQLGTLSVPLRLTPQPKGRWRWLGTRTVAFEPEGRLPYATDYTVTIPANTKSALGGRLEREQQIRFSTPRPKIIRALPYRYRRQTRPDTAIALLFNQTIDVKQLLSLITLSSKQGGGHDLEVVPKARWEKLRDIGSYVVVWDPERTVVLQPKKNLRKATGYTLKIAPGLRGEGPRVSKATLSHYFSTYGPLNVSDVRCGHYQTCKPSAGFRVSFTNPLVTSELSRFVSVSPKVSGMTVTGSGSYAYIKGEFEPQTRYTIRIGGVTKIGAELTDIHDQKLQKAYTKTLKTGDRAPQLSFPVRGLAALERTGKRLVPLTVTNVQTSRLRMVKVAPEQLFEVIQKARYSYDDNGRRDPLEGIKGIKVRRTLRTGVAPNGKGQVGIATDEALGRRGGGPVYIELRCQALQKTYRWSNPYRGIVVQVTDLALMARYGNDAIVGLVTHMQSGKPVTGARALLRDRKGKVIWRGTSDGEGMIRAPGRRALGGQHRAPFVLWVERGRDKSFVILDQSGDDGSALYAYSGWSQVPPRKTLKMHLFTDRSPYRPGQTVHVKGVLRVVDTTPTGGVAEAPAALKKVKVEVVTSRGHAIAKREVAVSKSGAFALDVKIPAGADLGAYFVRVYPRGGPYGGQLHGMFRVEEYRPPEFKVEVETAKGPHFIGQTLSAKVGADYLFGAPMRGAKVSWTLSRKHGHYTPPGNPGFSFADPVPWRWRWRRSRVRRRHRGGRRIGYVWRQRGADGEIIASKSGILDASGRVGVEAKLSEDKEDKRVGPLTYTLEAQVVDANRQSIANRRSLVVHPASVYVGLRAKKTVIRAGESVDLEAVLVDLEGKRQAGTSLEIEALQVKTTISTVFEDGRWTYKYESKEERVTRCKVKTADVPARCSVKLPKTGAFKLRASAVDDKGRKTRTTIRVYAYGPGYVPWRLKNQEKLELVPDKKRYEVGDVAKILVKSPLKRAIGLFSVQRGGIDRIERLQMKGNAQVIEVPIKAHHLPNVYVAVALGRGRSRDKALGKAAKDLGRPTFAHGSLRLPVSIAEKTLKVAVKPARVVVGPSETLKIELQTTDHQGKPAASELAVMLVDEGVLSLLGYQTPDPNRVFWANRGLGAPLADLRNVLLARQKSLVANKRRSQPMRHSRYRKSTLQRKAYALQSSYDGRGKRRRGVSDKQQEAPPMAATEKRSVLSDRSAPQRIRSRSVFATTAYYNPSVITDASGKATITVPMPDNLTTFRIMAVALDRGHADRFGQGEAQVKVRKPLLLRPSLPRFLSVGDRFEAAVMVHNNTDKDGVVDVLVRGRNAKPTRGNRRRVTIPARGSKEVRFSMGVAQAGPSRIQFAAVLGAEVDAVEKQVPVLLPVTTEAFATYGMTDKSVAQPVVPPKNALPGYGGLEVSMSSTALNGLEDSVRYLVRYPWECTEQTASRVIPIFALKDILKDFQIGKLRDQKKRAALARASVRKLESYQRWDGGWGFWKGSRQSWLYISTYATMALVEAKRYGEKIDASKLRRARQFLKRRLDRPSRFERYDYASQAAAVWLLSGFQQHEKQHMTRLFGLHQKLPMFARAWLMTAIFRAEGKTNRVEELLRQLNNAAVQTASAAHFAEGDTESLRLLMHSNDRTDAIVLAALLEVAPKHPLMPKIARGLLQSRVRGRWSTTQSNAYALMALSRYYAQVEKVVPDHISQIWYGDGYLGKGTFQGREMKVVQQKIPLAALRKLGDQQLVLAKQGKGKLYYRIGMRYAPRDLMLPPQEQGFSVSRVYEPIQDPKGKVLKDTVKRRDDGSWEIKAGSTVRVRVVVVVPDRRYFVAVMDPLPAGLEAVNLRFKTSASSRLAGQLDNRTYDSWSWYSLFAFSHRELRDDRVVLFSDRLPAGVYEYTYLARATNYGSFVVAPVKAEEMYHPETFGRSGTTWVHVK